MLLVPHVLVGPAPFLTQLGFKKIDSPASFLLNLPQNRQNFFLLFEISEALGTNTDASDAGTCHAAK